MNLSKLSVSTKIGVGFGFMIVAVIGAGLFCWIMIHLIEGEWNDYAVVIAEKKASVAGAAIHLQRANNQAGRQLRQKADARQGVSEEI